MRRLFAFVPLLVVMCALAALCLQNITDVDYWWQLNTGREVAQYGPPRVERLMASIAGTPRTEPEWFYCLALYEVVEHAGVWCAVVLKACILLCALAMIAAAAGAGRRPVAVAPVLLLGVLAASQRLGMRPEAVSYFFLGAFGLVLGGRRRHRRAALILLPMLQVLWINMHALAVLGPGLVGLRLAIDWARAVRLRARRGSAGRRAGRVIRVDLVLLVLVVGACLANPYGAQIFARLAAHWGRLVGVGEDRGLWLLGAAACMVALVMTALWLLAPRLAHGRRKPPRPLSTVRARAACALALTGAVIALGIWAARPGDEGGLRGAIIELEPTFLLTRFWPVDCFLVLLGLGALTFVSGPPWRAGLWSAASLVGLFAATLSVRALPLFALPVVVLLGRSPALRFLERPRAGRLAGVLTMIGAATLTYAAVTDRLYVPAGDERSFGTGVARCNDPAELAGFLKNSGITGVFDSHRLGGALAYRGLDVNIDSRVAGPLLAEYMELTRALRSGHAEILQRYAGVVLDADALVEIAALNALPGWRLVYADPLGVVFLHANRPWTAPAIRLDAPWLEQTLAVFPPARPASARGWLDTMDTPLLHQRLGRICLVLGYPDSAARLLTIAGDVLPSRFMDHSALAQALFGAGDFERASKVIEQGLERSASDPQLLRQGVFAELALARLDAADLLARRLLEASPDEAESEFLAGTVALRRGNLGDAAHLLASAASKRPDHTDTQANLGVALLGLGRYAEAVAAFQAAQRLDPADPGIRAGLAEAIARLEQAGAGPAPPAPDKR